MYRIIISFLLIFTLHVANAQKFGEDRRTWYDQSVAAVHVSTPGEPNRSGVAFVIGADENNIYLLTANHVVGLMGNVVLSFADGHFAGPADVKKHNSNFDVALLTITNKKWSGRLLPYAKEVIGGDPVFSISIRDNGRKLLPEGAAASVQSVKDDQLDCNLGIKEGDSGSPVFTAAGVAGMMCRLPGKGVPVSLLKELAQDWGAPWQLPGAIVDKPVEEITIPDSQKETALPILSMRHDQTYEVLKPLYDGNGSSSFKFDQAGWQSITVSFDKEYTFNRIKVLSPINAYVDFTSGYILLPESEKKFYWTSMKSPVMERTAEGNWVVYELKKYYRESKVTLYFKVTKDSKEKPDPVTLYEIKFTGPKQ